MVRKAGRRSARRTAALWRWVAGPVRSVGHRISLQVPALALAVVGLFLPWVGLNLGTQIQSISLRIVGAGMAPPEWVSYGLLCAVIAVLAALALAARRRGAAAIAGLMLLLLPLLFLGQSVIADYRLQLQIASDHAAFTQIIRAGGYTVPRGIPKLSFFLPITGEWATVLGTFRLGWLFTALGGLATFIGGFAELRASMRRAPRRFAVAIVLAAAVLVAYVGRGIIANAVASTAYADVRDGDYSTAASHLRLAVQLNDQLPLTATYDLALGRTLERTGDTQSPLALYTHARDIGALKQVQASLSILDQAHAEDPGNAVIAVAFDTALRTYALSNNDPTPLQTALSEPGLGGPLDDFAVGLILRRLGDYATAIGHFRSVIQAISDPDVRSAVYTQIALCEQGLGHSAAARTDLLTAIALDYHDYNTLARAAALGLYSVGGG